MSAYHQVISLSAYQFVALPGSGPQVIMSSAHQLIKFRVSPWQHVSLAGS